MNLSAVHLIEPSLVDTFTTVLRETGPDPTLRELEITESISIKTAPNLIENLNALHRLGCHIAINDLGTGAASLDYLRRLPADRIKIDQSFVRTIGVNPDDERSSAPPSTWRIGSSGPWSSKVWKPSSSSNFCASISVMSCGAICSAGLNDRQALTTCWPNGNV